MAKGGGVGVCCGDGVRASHFPAPHRALPCRPLLLRRLSASIWAPLPLPLTLPRSLTAPSHRIPSRFVSSSLPRPPRPGQAGAGAARRIRTHLQHLFPCTALLRWTRSTQLRA